MVFLICVAVESGAGMDEYSGDGPRLAAQSVHDHVAAEILSGTTSIVVARDEQAVARDRAIVVKYIIQAISVTFTISSLRNPILGFHWAFSRLVAEQAVTRA